MCRWSEHDGFVEKCPRARSESTAPRNRLRSWSWPAPLASSCRLWTLLFESSRDPLQSGIFALNRSSPLSLSADVVVPPPAGLIPLESFRGFQPKLHPPKTEVRLEVKFFQGFHRYFFHVKIP
ncbi:hypothetical protein JTB14_022357 [Gonioctena quinquepunctata]|nr:hypothetical protein JTB14_022357 [Gonioctena quinquepunctata]